MVSLNPNQRLQPLLQHLLPEHNALHLDGLQDTHAQQVRAQESDACDGGPRMQGHAKRVELCRLALASQLQTIAQLIQPLAAEVVVGEGEVHAIHQKQGIIHRPAALDVLNHPLDLDSASAANAGEDVPELRHDAVSAAEDGDLVPEPGVVIGVDRLAFTHDDDVHDVGREGVEAEEEGFIITWTILRHPTQLPIP